MYSSDDDDDDDDTAPQNVSVSKSGAGVADMNSDSDEDEDEQEEKQEEKQSGTSAKHAEEEEDDEEDEEEEAGHDKRTDAAASGGGDAKDAASDDDSDDDDDDDSDDDRRPKLKAAPRGASAAAPAPAPSSARGRAPNAKAKMTIAEIEHENILLYMKRCYGIPDENVVIRGKPLGFKSGAEMGKLLYSKSPDEWSSVKSYNVTVLEHDGIDYLYISCFVEGSPEAEFDKVRIHSIPKSVSKALVTRFSEKSYIPPDRLPGLKRLLEYKEPTGPRITPQINPEAAKFPLYKAESNKVPTALIKPQSKPRVLKTASSKYGKKSASAPADSGESNSAPPPPSAGSALSGKRTASHGSMGDESATSSTANVDAASPRENADASAPPQNPPAPTAPNDASASASSAPLLSQKRGATNDVSFHASSGVKRYRSIQVENVEKTHVWSDPNGTIHVIEYV